MSVDTNAYLRTLREILLNFTHEELLAMGRDLGVAEYIDWSGPRSIAAVNLIASVERAGRIEDLASMIQSVRPEASDGIRFAVKSRAPSDELVNLSVEIANIRQQLMELRESSLSNEALENRLQEMIQVADRAAGRSDELTARLVLPSSELTDVPLIPIHTLERLEEYRSDENIAYLLIGLFGGAILGILSNWATDEKFTISRFSIVLILVFVALTVVSWLWTRRIHKRAASVKEKMFPHGTACLEGDQSR